MAKTDKKTLASMFVGRMGFSVTNVLVILNLTVFVTMVVLDGFQALLLPSEHTLIDFGANFAPLTAGLEPWRIITCAFVHANLLHLIINMLVLFVLGHDIEKEIGPWRFLALYLALAFSGSVVSLAFTDIGKVGVGASGATCGLLGFTIVFAADPSKLSLKDAIIGRILVFIFFVAIMIYEGFLIPFVDNAAHLGGLVTGVFAGLLFLLAKRVGKPRLAYLGMSAICLVAFVGFLTVQNNLSHRPELSGHRDFMEATRLLRNKQYAQALPLLDKAIDRVPNDPRFELNRARTLIELQEYDRALGDLEHCQKELPGNIMVLILKSMALHAQGHYDLATAEVNKALAISPNDPQLYNNLAWSQVAHGQIKEALANANRALKDGPDYPALDTRGVAYVLLGKTKEALSDLNAAIKQKPEEAAAYFHRAALYHLLGDDDLADKDLLLALKLNYQPESWEKNAFSSLLVRLDDLKIQSHTR